MSLNRLFWTVVVAAAIVAPATLAEAKGPKGGHGKGPSFQPGSPQGQGSQGGNWTSPPGWSEGEKKGWDNSDTPPWSDNGKRKGWDTSVPPGLDKKR